MTKKQRYEEYLSQALPGTLAGSYYRCVHDFKKSDPIAYEVGLGEFN